MGSGKCNQGLQGMGASRAVRVCLPMVETGRVLQGFFRIIKNQWGGGDPSPKTPSPPPQTKGTIVGKNEIYNRENLVRPFLVHQVLGPKPPPPLPPPPPCSKEALVLTARCGVSPARTIYAHTKSC